MQRPALVRVLNKFQAFEELIKAVLGLVKDLLVGNCRTFQSIELRNIYFSAIDM
jgi:hypothetical protein